LGKGAQALKGQLKTPPKGAPWKKRRQQTGREGRKSRDGEVKFKIFFFCDFGAKGRVLVLPWVGPRG